MNITGWRCPTDSSPDPFVVRLVKARVFDREGCERTKRINGAITCPHCGLMWPIIEEPDVWIKRGGKMVVAEYGPGTAECLACKAVFVDTFDGVRELKLDNKGG